MLHPEINLSEYIPVKALAIYEICGRLKQNIIDDRVLNVAIKNNIFENPNEYFDCLTFFFSIGFVEYDNGLVRFANK